MGRQSFSRKNSEYLGWGLTEFAGEKMMSSVHIGPKVKAMDTPQERRREEDRLAVELHFYAAHKQEFLKSHSGEYVVIQGTKVLGFFQSWEGAFRSGVKAFGVSDDFLVKQVLERDRVYFVFVTQPSCSLPSVRQRYQQATER